MGVINEILDFSKIESGQLIIDRAPLSLAPTLAQIESLLGTVAHSKGLNLHIECSPKLQTLMLVGDGLRLEQVLINLVGNAIKFTERGDVWLRVELQTITDSKARVRFEVRDTGIGIEPENVARLFEPFIQADTANTRRFGGTGLGLSISKRLVELMGGVIYLDSEVDVGTTFWCELPFDLEDHKGFVPQESSQPLQKVGPRLSGIHCLVVDDTRMNRLIVEQMLSKEGARATLAVDGQQAVQYLQAEPNAFDAVLMDVQMPVMDGLAATRAILKKIINGKKNKKKK
jgi:hypothetical protein